MTSSASSVQFSSVWFGSVQLSLSRVFFHFSMPAFFHSRFWRLAVKSWPRNRGRWASGLLYSTASPWKCFFGGFKGKATVERSLHPLPHHFCCDFRSLCCQVFLCCLVARLLFARKTLPVCLWPHINAWPYFIHFMAWQGHLSSAPRMRHKKAVALSLLVDTSILAAGQQQSKHQRYSHSQKKKKKLRKFHPKC